jgi:hypothetical protein
LRDNGAPNGPGFRRGHGGIPAAILIACPFAFSLSCRFRIHVTFLSGNAFALDPVIIIFQVLDADPSPDAGRLLAAGYPCCQRSGRTSGAVLGERRLPALVDQE